MGPRQSPGSEGVRSGGRRAWLALWCLLLSVDCHAAAAVARFECESGVCGFNVLESRLVVAPCAGRSVLAAYSESSGITLLQCTSDEGPSETLGYVFDRSRPKAPALELSGIRFVKANALRAAAEHGIPDRFGVIPLCVAPGPARVGQLVMVARQPGPDPQAGDCFRVLRAVSTADGLDVRADDAAPVSARQAAPDLWTTLRRNLRPFLGPVTAPRPQGSITRGNAQRATLHAEPRAARGTAGLSIATTPDPSWTARAARPA